MKKTMLILTVILLIAGAVLLCVSIITARTSLGTGWYLPAALLCILAANTINFIRMIRERKGK
ncbi:MAG: hypothetical protein II885_18570 [Oscillospiraceae bacterium]|nr:hypothetical protein [Oscillospiraceae bacterium]